MRNFFLNKKNVGTRIYQPNERLSLKKRASQGKPNQQWTLDGKKGSRSIVGYWAILSGPVVKV